MNVSKKIFTLGLMAAAVQAAASDRSDPHADHQHLQLLQHNADPAVSESTASAAHAHHGARRADADGPIGVMATHNHPEGEWMLSYRTMRMEMDGSRDGSRSLNRNEVHRRGYHVAPEEMTMVMHMFGAMYAPTDRLTLMAMVPLLKNDMDLNMRMAMPVLDTGMADAMGGGMASDIDGGMPASMDSGMADNTMAAAPMMPSDTQFSTDSDGLGDIKIGGLYSLARRSNVDRHSNLIFNFALSLPTGSIDNKDVTAMSGGQRVQLPYPMQLGSGTYDLIPGLTYTVVAPEYSWGAQTNTTLRLGDNDNGYTLGDRFMATAWYGRPFQLVDGAGDFGWSLRLAYEYWGDVDGEDKKLDMQMMGNYMTPSADPDLHDGERVDVAAGLNWLLPGGANKLGFEISKPVYQHLDGPQMERDYNLTLGWQLSL